MSAVSEAPTADEIGQPTGASLIAAERQRQKDVEGYTDEHDAEHGSLHFVSAGAAYEWNESHRWPWDAACTFKPKDILSNLIRAGALYQVAADLSPGHARDDVQPLVDRVAAKIDGILAAAYPLLVARITSQAKAEGLREAEVRMFGTEGGGWLPDLDTGIVVGEFRRLLRDHPDWIEAGDE